MLARLLAVCATAAVFVVALSGPAAAHSSRQSTRAMAAQINVVRAHYGLPPLRVSPSLTRSTRRFSHRLMATDRFGHASRIRASAAFHGLGEALAMHSGSRDQVARTVLRWLRSPPHRAIVLHRSMRWLGAGVSHGRFGRWPATIWVLQIGRR